MFRTRDAPWCHPSRIGMAHERIRTKTQRYLAGWQQYACLIAQGLMHKPINDFGVPPTKSTYCIARSKDTVPGLQANR
jgi:hypothetical protein